jgi:hypothetical protein
MNTDSTSYFFNEVDKIGYSGGGTDILAGLQLAINEIDNYSKHNLTVVSEYPTYSKSTVESVAEVKGEAFRLILAKSKVIKFAKTGELI